MARYLLCATPAGGHVTPVLTVACGLRDRGHDVAVLTGSRFREVVESAGVEFRPLTGAADIDDRDPDSFLPERDRYRGLRLAQYQLRRMFIDPVPAQARDVAESIRWMDADAVIADSMFLGTLPMLDSATGVPVVALGVSPLSLPSLDSPPYNSGLVPVSGPIGHLRDRVLGAAVTWAFRGLDRDLDRVVCSVAGRGPDCGLFGIGRRYDRYLHLGPAEFEYPRRDLPSNVRFVGSLGLEAAPSPRDLPEWWPELDGRHVVHVTQGTAANFDPTTLIRPTIAALADSDLLVVVSTGGLPVERLGPLPKNVRAAEFIPHSILFEHADVFVTNGGYGAVTNALAHGVPIVVAPGGEDKREVAAHVRHFGVGVDLRCERPSADRIAAAVHRVLDTARYRKTAEEMARACTRYHPLDTIEAELVAVSAGTAPMNARGDESKPE